MSTSLLLKIKSSNIIGRGGAEFPAATKWQYVKNAKGDTKYVICNASEGELGIFKDIHILKQHLREVFKGMIHAMDYLETKEAYFNIKEDYYNEIDNALNNLIQLYADKGYSFKVYKEKPSYIGGEETALLNAIEGKRVEPRLKPPYPASHGLFDKPTLVHNVETLYNIALVAEDRFEDKRFYSISGDITNPGVYYFPADITVEQVLMQSNNWEEWRTFFAQIGGSASGPVFNKEQLRTEKPSGAGSIEVYDMHTRPTSLLKKWFKFYSEESCGKCSPCREGTYQLYELIKNINDDNNIPWDDIKPIIKTMETTSFCPLGRSISIPIGSYIKNVLYKDNG